MAIRLHPQNSTAIPSTTTSIVAYPSSTLPLFCFSRLGMTSVPKESAGVKPTSVQILLTVDVVPSMTLCLAVAMVSGIGFLHSSPFAVLVMTLAWYFRCRPRRRWCSADLNPKPDQIWNMFQPFLIPSRAELYKDNSAQAEPIKREPDIVEPPPKGFLLAYNFETQSALQETRPNASYMRKVAKPKIGLSSRLHIAGLGGVGDQAKGSTGSNKDKCCAGLETGDDGEEAENDWLLHRRWNSSKRGRHVGGHVDMGMWKKRA